ncbi:MAG: NAD-dependent epimerase/dehydratase family protein, partial [Candidatus Electrothrix sp. LOE2]|nr:NAD-dependent epimerase/dehydratase family protein [Candidatus Electrothrix sp. LOE2]
IVQALKGEDITIYGSGQQTRSFCYIDDMIEGFSMVMNTDSGFTRLLFGSSCCSMTVRRQSEQSRRPSWSLTHSRQK